MKKPQIDVFTDVTQGYLNQVAFKKKFLRLWGHNGSVLNKKHYYYPNMSAGSVKLFKFLGMYEDLKAAKGSMEGIENAWVELNAGKYSYSPSATAIQALEFSVPDGTYEITVVPDATLNRVPDSSVWGTVSTTAEGEDVLDLLGDQWKNPDGSIKQEDLKQYIIDNYAQILTDYIVEGITIPETEDGAVDAAMANIVAILVLGGSDAFGAVIKSLTYVPVNRTKKVVKYVNDGKDENGDPVRKREVLSYPYSTVALSIQMQIAQIGVVEEDDPIVTKIVSGTINTRTYGVMRTGLLFISGVTTKTDSIWFDGQLRVAAFSATTIKTKDLIPILQGSLDTGYQKKKTKWYKKLLAIIVFVVAFVFSGGLSATSIGTFAASFTVATLAVSLLSAAMMAWGDETGAAATGRFAQKIGVVASIIGFTAMINSIATQLSSMATKAASEGLLKVATDKVKNYVTDVFKKYTTDLTLERGLQATSRIFNMYSKNKIKDLREQVKTTEAQLADSEQFEEENRSRDLGRSLIKSHGELLHQDSDDKYDYQYESWSSPMHVGNVCRTGWKWDRTGAKDGLSSVLV